MSVTFFSLGFRCSSASILKKMNLKTESYPFDWLISDLSVIRHCIETDFQEFVNPSHYEKKYTNTYEMAESRQGFVCDEHLMVNRFYQPLYLMNEENTYQYKLAMNHHNITEPKDAEYYSRCIQRFRELLQKDTPKRFLHICPLVTLEKYDAEKEEILTKCQSFDSFLSLKGLYFILVKDKKNPSECRGELIHESHTTGSKIFVLYVNPHFVDAGETFMGEYEQEVLFIQKEITQIT